MNGAPTWSADAWSLLDSAAQRWVDAQLASNLLIRTHAQHIVSDAPSALRFARTWADHHIRLAYDPASMSTPATAPALADLYSRRIDALTNPELARAVAFIFITNLKPGDSGLIPSPIDDGLLDPALIRASLAICADLQIPTAILHTDLPTLSLA